MTKPQTIIAGYLTLQAIAVAAWWGMLIGYSNSVSWFRPAGWPDESLLAFGIADGILLVAGSLFAAESVVRKRAWSTVAVWCVAATAWYATLYCLCASVLTGEAWLATSLMTCMSGLSLVVATMVGIEIDGPPKTIRATRLSKSNALRWTLLQIVVFWSVFLWILPNGIIEIQNLIEMPLFRHSGQTACSITLFAAASALGLSSGITMSTRGSGTPLPTATAPTLVIAGPYRIVRNPMAIAGIAQGIAVGWLTGSVLVILYSIAGAFVWHFVARPIEEADLVERFGDAYISYREQTGLWLP